MVLSQPAGKIMPGLPWHPHIRKHNIEGLGPAHPHCFGYIGGRMHIVPGSREAQSQQGTKATLVVNDQDARVFNTHFVGLKKRSPA
jgi:hypothetical protein